MILNKQKHKAYGKIKFFNHINAPKEKVWKVLWDDSSYRKWTSVFMEGSYVVPTTGKKALKSFS